MCICVSSFSVGIGSGGECDGGVGGGGGVAEIDGEQELYMVKSVFYLCVGTYAFMFDKCINLAVRPLLVCIKYISPLCIFLLRHYFLPILYAYETCRA